MPVAAFDNVGMQTSHHVNVGVPKQVCSSPHRLDGSEHALTRSGGPKKDLSSATSSVRPEPVGQAQVAQRYRTTTPFRKGYLEARTNLPEELLAAALRSRSRAEIEV